MKLKPLFHYLPPPSMKMQEQAAILCKELLENLGKNTGLRSPMKYLLKTHKKIFMIHEYKKRGNQIAYHEIFKKSKKNFKF